MRFDSLPLPATMLGFAILCITAQESGLDGHGLSTGNPDLLARGGTNEDLSSGLAITIAAVTKVIPARRQRKA